MKTNKSELDFYVITTSCCGVNKVNKDSASFDVETQNCDCCISSTYILLEFECKCNKYQTVQIK